MNSNFKGPMTGTPLPGVTKKIRKLLLTREEVAQTIERLIAILDEIDGEPELEPTGDEEEPTLGWPAGGMRMVGSTMDGEAEPSLGWTGIINQASRNRLGDGEDYEKDDADHEDSDPGEENGDMEPSLGWETGSIGSLPVDGSMAWPKQILVTDPGIDQTALGGFSDADLEDDAGREPSLGALINIDQTNWARGESLDCEPNGDEADTSETNDEHYSHRLLPRPT